MIFGIGTDIVEISRIEKAMSKSERFAQRILSPFEYEEFSASNQATRYLAKKFAVKEAIVKAMGTGIGNGISWQMLQIEHDDMGKPLLVASAGVQDFFDKHAIVRCHISISDERHYASANCVLEQA